MTVSSKPDVGQALVTGASSGIGAAVARRLAVAGYDVLGVARRQHIGACEEPHSDDVAARLSSVAVDLSDLDALPDAAQTLAKRRPSLSVVVLAAGAGRFGSLEQHSYRDISDLINLNLTANLFLCKALLPVLKRRGEGKLIFVGSEAALHGKRQGSLYCASKFGVRGLAQALRDECSGSGVSVSVIEPGMVRTPFFDELDFEPGPSDENALAAEQVADAVAYIVASPASAVIDEIELSPLKRVVQKKPQQTK